MNISLRLAKDLTGFKGCSPREFACFGASGPGTHCLGGCLGCFVSSFGFTFPILFSCIHQQRRERYYRREPAYCGTVARMNSTAPRGECDQETMEGRPSCHYHPLNYIGINGSSQCHKQRTFLRFRE